MPQAKARALPLADHDKDGAHKNPRVNWNGDSETMPAAAVPARSARTGITACEPLDPADFGGSPISQMNKMQRESYHPNCADLSLSGGNFAIETVAGTSSRGHTLLARHRQPNQPTCRFHSITVRPVITWQAFVLGVPFRTGHTRTMPSNFASSSGKLSRTTAMPPNGGRRKCWRRTLVL